jgi:hypothetical protein
LPSPRPRSAIRVSTRASAPTAPWRRVDGVPLLRLAPSFEKCCHYCYLLRVGEQRDMSAPAQRVRRRRRVVNAARRPFSYCCCAAHEWIRPICEQTWSGTQAHVATRPSGPCGHISLPA